MRILVTGSAGFVGFHLATRLLKDGHEVSGLDAMTPYYDVTLKQNRHAVLKRHNGFYEAIQQLEDRDALETLISAHKPEIICHLAAQAGVRYCIEHPRAYVDANLIGTFNIIEAARHHKLVHLLMASTSSVYGANTEMPFRENDKADTPLTLYAATKKATELMSHSYSHIWDIPTTMFRFFSVYGPWGRPDMALFKFVEAMLKDQPIDVYNGGDMLRDFTYVEDLVEGIVRLFACPPERGKPVGPKGLDSLSPVAPWRAVNIGRGAPVNLNDFISEIERCLGRKAKKNLLPMQVGDVAATTADASLLFALTGYRPATAVPEGVQAFCDWYQDHYAVK